MLSLRGISLRTAVPQKYHFIFENFPKHIRRRNREQIARETLGFRIFSVTLLKIYIFQPVKHILH